jgi:hypothetical protein
MEKRRCIALLVAVVTLFAFGGAQARRKKKHAATKPPVVSLACQTDDDCALTNFRDGECCPMLCQPRAVSKASAEAINKWSLTCEKPYHSERCPALTCAPPRFTPVPACVSGKCETHAASRD